MKADRWADSLLANRATHSIVLAFALVLFAGTNLPWQLDDYDQAKQAFTSFEMVQQNHWLYQHTPNGWVATKPPLVGWLSAATYALTRSWEIAWRLPSFVAAIALLVLIWRAALRAFGRNAAFIAASAFALNLFSPRLATLARTDMPLALVLFLIGERIWNKMRTRSAWRARDRWIIFALLSAAMLIKGPIVYAFLLPGIIACEWHRRSTAGATSAWCGWWPWLASFAVFICWLIGGIIFVPEFFDHVVVREFAGRFSDAIHRSQPVYFYLVHLLHRFAPWSILLVACAALGARTPAGSRAQLRRMSPEIFWLIAWSVGGVIAMSFVPSKRIDRIFPVVPPLCLLLGAQFAAASNNRRHLVAILSFVAVALALLFACVYAAMRIVPGYKQHRDAFVLFGRQVRAQAAAHDMRYEIVGGEDEGMALYLRRTRFFEPDEAAKLWANDAVDALVVPDDELDELEPRLRGAVRSEIGPSQPAGHYGKRYFLLVRARAQ